MEKIRRWLKAAVRSEKALICVSLVGIAAVAGVQWLGHARSSIEHTTSKRHVVTHSTDTPDEVKPTAGYKWQGGFNDPKKIKIASVGVDAYVQQVGVDQHKSIAVPNNVHMGGWFVDSVRPGDKGLSIIDGHYDGRVQTEAIFKDLPKVQAGNQIIIEFGNGTTRTFAVSRTVTTTIADTPAVLFSQDAKATNQLNLVTCGGTYDRQKQTYDKRVIVVAQLVP